MESTCNDKHIPIDKATHYTSRQGVNPKLYIILAANV